MDGYWKDRPDPKMKAAILADWMDELEDWTIDQIRYALRRWRSECPSKKPNPAHIATVLKAARGRAYVEERDTGKAQNAAFAISNDQKLLAAQ